MAIAIAPTIVIVHGDRAIASTPSSLPFEPDHDRHLQNGYADLDQQRFLDALHQFEMALEYYQSIGDRTGEADALLGIASTYPYTETHTLDEIIQFILEGHRIFSENNDTEGQQRAVELLQQQILDEAEYYGNHALEQDGIILINQTLPIFQAIDDPVGEAAALDFLSHFYFSLDQFPQGIEAAQRSLAIYDELGDTEFVIQGLRQLGERYQWTNQLQAAINIYQEAIAIAQSSNHLQLEVEALQSLSDLYQRVGNLSTAIQFHDRMIDIHDRMDSRSDAIRTRISRANLYQQNSSVEHAIADYRWVQQNITIEQETPYLAYYREASEGLCRSYILLDDRSQALSCYSELITMVSQFSEIDATEVLIDAGNQFLAIGDPQQALIFHEQAILSENEVNWSDDREAILFSQLSYLPELGKAYLDNGYIETALTIQSWGLQLLQSAATMSDVECDENCRSLLIQVHAFNLLNSTVPLLLIDSYQTETLQIRRDILSIIQQLDNTEQSLYLNAQIRDAEQVGHAYYQKGQYPDAILAYRNGLEQYHRCLDCRSWQIQPSLMQLGDSYLFTGQVEQATVMHQLWIDLTVQQIQASTRGGDIVAEDAQMIRAIASRYLNNGYATESADFFQQAVQIEQTWLATGERDVAPMTQLDRIQFLNQWGQDYLSYNQTDQSFAYHQQTLIIDHELQRQTEIESNQLDFIGESYAHLGAIWAAVDEPELAIVFYKAAINHYEAIRGTTTDSSIVTVQDSDRIFVYVHTEDYRQLTDLLLEQDRVLEAQEVLDLMKLQEIDDYQLIVEGTPSTQQGLELWEPEHAILDWYRQQIYGQPNPTITSMRQHPFILEQVNSLQQTTRGQNINPAQLASLQDDLQQLGNAALLYPLILDDRLELVLVTPAGLVRQTVDVEQSVLHDAIAQFRIQITDRRSRPQAQAQQLYQWIIQPILADLEAAGVEIILYAADGPLRYIPLAALHDGESWLVEQYTINHITAASLTDFSETGIRSMEVISGAFPSEPVPVIVGDRQIVFEGLPFAQSEVQQLVATIPNTTSFFNQNFNRSILDYLNQYNIVHFATHAEFRSGHPSDSFIVLGDGDYITVEDLTQWQLPDVELVILSACRTAVSGQLGNGEEVLGFGYQIQQTGANAAIASLWYVNDEGTHRLMTAFYTALSNGYTVADALQVAQTSLISGSPASEQHLDNNDIGLAARRNELSHPYYWAPFILIGNGF
jgi:CHAT domain-containing protein